MIITHAKNGLKIETDENQIPVLVLENQAVFSEFIEDFYRQCDGDDGEIVLSEEGKMMALSKSAMIVSDYFSLDLNGSRIRSRLYREMESAGIENGIEKDEFTRQGIELLEKIISSARFDHVVYDLDLDWSNIFKLFGLRIEEDYLSLQEKIISFLRIASELLNLKLVAFVNLKAYLSDQRLLEIYQIAKYLKLNLLLIESKESEALSSEKVYIIDKDKCLIIK